MVKNLTIQERKQILILHHQKYNISEISRELHVSRGSVRRWVKRFDGVGSLNDLKRHRRPARIKKSQKPDKKPKVNYKEQRLHFSREYLDFNWETTIFSDEKTWTSHTESGSVHMWGWISAQGPGELVFLSPQADSANYVQILNDIMLPTILTVYSLEDLNEISFLHDNSSAHRSIAVRKWFERHSFINVISCPSRSPDFNPMENIWRLMIKKWEARDERSPEQLEAHCMQIWDDLRGTDFCENIVSSMRSRLLRCIKHNEKKS